MAGNNIYNSANLLRKLITHLLSFLLLFQCACMLFVIYFCNKGLSIYLSSTKLNVFGNSTHLSRFCIGPEPRIYQLSFLISIHCPRCSPVA